MVEECENNIIPPPIEFRDDYKPFPAPRTKKPAASLRTKIGQRKKPSRVSENHSPVKLKNQQDPLPQLQNTRKAIEHRFKTILGETQGFKFNETQNHL